MTDYRVSLADGSSFAAGADETLLDAARRAHWLVRYGCRNGNCFACGATLLHGAVLTHGAVVDSAGTEILLCQCRARADLTLVLPGNPLPGSTANARRVYARVAALQPIASGFRVALELPAGRQPDARRGQIALLEIDGVDVRGDIEALHDRELVLRVGADVALSDGAFLHLRYPLGGAQ